MDNFDKKEWFVVFSKPRREEFAQYHLRTKGLETFFPRLMLPKISRKTKQIVPLFPNYLFVRMNLIQDYNHVRWAPGVKHLVNFGGRPVPLDDKVARDLIEQSDNDGIIAAHSNLKVGQEVQLRGGPFDGVLGIIQKTADAHGRVQLLMGLRRISVQVPVHLLAIDWVVNGARTVAADALGNRLESSVLV